jgi:Uncharacterized protein conserved in bacteria (DUF2188)
MKKNQWVIQRGNEWAVRGERNERDTSRHPTQKEAINAGRAIAKNQGSELIVTGEDGLIREKNSYGPDKFPTRG